MFVRRNQFANHEINLGRMCPAQRTSNYGVRIVRKRKLIKTMCSAEQKKYGRERKKREILINTRILMKF
jgi:hypothetical protein